MMRWGVPGPFDMSNRDRFPEEARVIPRGLRPPAGKEEQAS